MVERTGITRHDREIAIKVLMQSRQVQNWVEGISKSFGINPDTPEGKLFSEKESRKAAERLLR